MNCKVLQSFLGPQDTIHLKKLFDLVCWEVISGQDPTFAKSPHLHEPWDGQQDQDWPEQTRSCSRRISPAQHGTVTALSQGWLDQQASEGSGCCGLPQTPLLHWADSEVVLGRSFEGHGAGLTRVVTMP